MDCGVPFCHNGCPLGQPDPRLERPRLPRPLAGRDRAAARDEQLPRVHRPAVPGAVRGGVRARDPRGRRGHDQTDRERDHQPRLGGGLGRCRSRRARETGQSVAVVGSGPAGMAAAQQLRRAGHRVTLFERDEAIGGLVRFGVPDFKIEKTVVQRRVEQLVAEGVELRCGVDVGRDVSVQELRARLRRGRAGDRLARAARPAGARAASSTACTSRWTTSTSATAGSRASSVPSRPCRAARPPSSTITAQGKDVVVIGGGDTGADCVGNALREGARSIVQLELLPEPPAAAPRRPHAVAAVAAEVPPQLRDGGGQGAARRRAGLLGHDDALLRRRQRQRSRRCTSPRRSRRRRSRRSRAPSASCRRSWCCWRWASCTPSRSCSTSSAWRRTRAATSRRSSPYTTSVDGVFAAGDARRGQSLIVWAINEGRQCARMVDRYLAGPTQRRRADARPLARRGPRRPRRRRRGPRGAAAARRAGHPAED